MADVFVTKENMRIGMKVFRNNSSWPWGGQGLAPNGDYLIGTINGWVMDSQYKWVSVTWEDGTANNYRVGENDCYDLVWAQEEDENCYKSLHSDLLELRNHVSHMRLQLNALENDLEKIIRNQEKVTV